MTDNVRGGNLLDLIAENDALRALLAEARDEAYGLADGDIFQGDLGACPYLRNGPPSVCSFGCETEPACQTCHPPEGWLWQRVEELIGPQPTEGSS